MAKRYTRSERDELVREVTKRRASVRSAATRLGVSMSTAHRWLRASTATSDESDKEARASVRVAGDMFARLVPAKERDASLVVRVEGVELEVRAGFDGALLRSVVEALRGGEA